jgi:hypothetical protein
MATKGPLFPGDKMMESCRGSLEHARALIRGTKQPHPTPPSPRDGRFAREADARSLQDQGDHAKAADIWWSLVRENPGERFLVAQLASCYRGWIFEETKKGTPREELVAIVDLALERCPNSESLSDIQEVFADVPRKA